MLESVAGESGMVHLDVHLEVFVEIVGLEESDHGLRVDVILMLGGLHGLRLNEESALEPVGACIVTGHCEHTGEVFFLALLVGVEKAHVSLATTPEHVVGATQCDGGVDGVLDLHGGTGHYVEVRVGGSSIHIAGVTEDVGRSPEILDAGLLHQSFEICRDFLHTLLVVFDVVEVADEVGVVEAEIFDTELLHDFKACVGLLFGHGHGVVADVPGEFLCACAELVAAFSAERVPPCHGEFQPFFHGFAEHDFLGVIVAVGEGIVA